MLWIFLTLFGVDTIGQNLAKIDSLNSLLKEQIEEDRFETFVQLAIAYADNDNVKSLKNIDVALTIASDFEDSTKIVRAGRIKGQLLRRLERLDESIELFESILPTARRKNLNNDYKVILNSLALAYTLKADYDKALDYNFQSLVIREREGDKAEISISYNNIGLVYFKISNYEKAVEYYLKSLSYKKAVDDKYDLDRLLINLGLSYNQLNRYEDAKKYIDEAFEICGENCDTEILIDGKFGLGVTYYKLSRYPESEEQFSESLRISRSTDNKRFQAENLLYLGRIALANNDFDRAKSVFNETEEIAIQYGYNRLLIDTYKEFANYYNQSQDFENASLYQNKYIDLKDALIGEELVKNISKIQTQFEERKNIATIADREEALARQRMLNIAVGIIAVLAALLVFVLYRSNKVKQKVNSALSDAKAIIEDQNKELQAHTHILQREVDKATSDLKVVNASLEKANEELDNFIYKTSHDIRGPLASLKGMCNVALMDVKDPLALDYLSKLDLTAAKLNRILTRLLIINQINHTTVNPEPLDFNNIIDD
ncbi:MAG: tetratricopeptide repeat protein, partial [Cyclobacteriaceae bacterium]|nr:tetratricopeptide repeat protein [Cyclobacteriaceae bacterium]